MQHNDEDLVKMHTMCWMQDIVLLFKRRKKISHTNFISRSKIPMGFRNTDEVKHKFKRACTTTQLTERGGARKSAESKRDI